MAKYGNNIEKVKVQNSEMIREIIFRHAPISRHEIAEMLQLTPPTITTNVSELIKRGLVEECVPQKKTENVNTKKAVGRKRVLIDYVPNAAYLIGVDTGYYGTIACLTDIRGNVIEQVVYDKEEHNYNNTINLIVASIEELISKSNVKREKIAGIGLGMAGFVDRKSGILGYDAYHKWENKEVAQDIYKLTGIRCSIENNARCRALGEDLFDKNTLPESFAYLLVARGIACPLVIRNHLHVGDMASAGEIGHMVVEKNGKVCPSCKNKGCLDAVSSELAIKNKCIEILNSNAKTVLRDICDNIKEPQISEILQAQKSADKAVCEIMDDAIIYLGITIANIINFINPSMVLVDGYIMTNEQNKNLLIKVARDNIFYSRANDVEIRFVAFDKSKAAKGAAALAINEYIIKEQFEKST